MLVLLKKKKISKTDKLLAKQTGGGGWEEQGQCQQANSNVASYVTG